MNRKTKAGIAFLSGLSISTVGLGFLLSHESLSRNPFVLNKVFSLISPPPDENVDHSNEYSHTKWVEYDNWCKSQKAKEYEMTAKDGKKLVSYLIPSKTGSKVFVLCAHGYRGTKYGDFGAQAQFYHSLGYNVILVDQRASGKSEGDYIGFGYFESRDCLQWLRFYNDMFGSDIEFVVAGISMGGATVCMMSGSDELPENVKCIISDCAYTTADDEIRYCFQHYLGISAEPFLSLVNCINLHTAKYTFTMADAISAVKKAKVPILFIHGGADDFVPTKMVYELYDVCPTDKDLLIVEKAIHAQSFFEEPEKYQAKVKEFLSKHL